MPEDESIFRRLLRCTHEQSTSRQCDIFSALDDLNAELSVVELQLQEFEPRRLTLTTNSKNGQPRIHTDELGSSFWRDLESIIVCHQCIVSIDVDAADFRDKPTYSLVDVLIGKVQFLVRLRTRNMFTTEVETCCLACVLPLANELKELYLENNTAFDSMCVRYLRDFVCRTEKLAVLSITNVHVLPQDAASLFNALLKNSSIHTLKMSACKCFHGPKHEEPLIAAFIRKLALNSLTLERCCLKCKDAVVAIMLAVAMNRCISELSLRGFGFRVAVDLLMPILLNNNDVLRSLNLGCQERDSNECCNCASHLPKCPSDYSLFECFNLDVITTVINKNKRLEELTLDLSTSSLSHCERFFVALRLNTALRRVNIMGVQNRDAVGLCQSIRWNGVRKQVRILCPLRYERAVDAAALCAGFSALVLDFSEPAKTELLLRTLPLLPRCKEVRELSIRMPSDQLVMGYQDLSGYLSATTNLSTIALDIRGRVLDKHIRQNTMMAVLLNNKVQKLSVSGGMVLDADEARDVACALCCNNSLCEFTLLSSADPDNPDVVPISTVLCHMASFIDKNHTLCSFVHDTVPVSAEFHAVHSMVRRNRGLAIRAAHFVVGTDKSEYCAAAFSQLRDSPQLLIYVMKLASVDEANAADRIQQTQSLLER